MNKTDFENPVYYHSNSSTILKDININQRRFDNSIIFNNDDLFGEDEDNIYINTWFHLNHGFKYYQCTIESLYYNFTEIYKFLNIKLEDITYYIPKIDFNKFNILNIDKFFENKKYEKYVFVCNGLTLSGQSDNEILDVYIKILAEKYQDCLFILTEKFLTNIPMSNNIILSKDIINSTGYNDLNENSYLSTKCDILVGRTSGPSTFSIVVENVLNDNKQDILHLSPYKPFLNEKYYNKNKKLHCTPNSSNILQYIEKIINNK